MRVILAAGALSIALGRPAVAASEAEPPTPTPEEQKLLEEIEAATKPVPPTEDAASAKAGGGVGTSNLYNPAMSVNGLFLGSVTSDERPAPGQAATALAVQELELQLIASVDPYFLANLILALPEGEGIELEEGWVAPSAQPLGLAARFGKLKAPFGRENPLHTHALPFVDRSLAGDAIFGDEGFTEAGAELSYLFALPWYAVLYGGVVNGDNEVVFAAADRDELAGFAALKNVFDLSDDATLELGASYAGGRDETDEVAHVGGAHAVFKWRPARQARERQLIITLEALYASRTNDAGALGLRGDDAGLGGGYAYVQWRLSQRWHTAARYDYLGYPSEARGVLRRASGILVFAPTEFSAVRLQGSALVPQGPSDPTYEGFLQVNFTLGAHPAHAY